MIALPGFSQRARAFSQRAHGLASRRSEGLEVGEEILERLARDGASMAIPAGTTEQITPHSPKPI